MAVPTAPGAQLPARRRVQGSRRSRTRTRLPGAQPQSNHEAASSSHFKKQARNAGLPIKAPCTSSALQRAVAPLGAYSGLMLSEYQMKLLKRATAVLADALAGPNAPASLRLLLRRVLRGLALLAHAGSCALRIWALATSLAHLGDSALSVSTEAELANALTTLLCSTIVTPTAAASPSSPSFLLLRALASSSTLALDSIDIGAAAEGLGHLDGQHSADWLTGAAKAVDLLTVCPSLVESCQELTDVATEAASRPRRRQPRVTPAGGGASAGACGAGDCSDENATGGGTACSGSGSGNADGDSGTQA